MITKSITCPSDEYPNPVALLRTLLSRLIEMNNSDAWLTVEGRSNKGWVHDELFGKGPWLQIAFQDRQHMILNLGLKRKVNSLPMPPPWQQQKDGMWTVPTVEQEGLIKWICTFFRSFAGASKDCRLKGWIEG